MDNKVGRKREALNGIMSLILMCSYTYTCTFIAKVTESLGDQDTFNVAVAELMTFSNVIRDSPHLMGSHDYHEALCTLCTLLAPMAPHLASEMWAELRSAARHLNLPLTQVLVCTVNLASSPVSRIFSMYARKDWGDWGTRLYF